MKERVVKPDKNFKKYIEVWNTYYFRSKATEYLYSPKDFRNLKSLIHKIKQVDSTNKPEDNLMGFLCSIQSKWHLDNLSLPLINSHFNKLYSDAINKSRFDFNHYFEQNKNAF